ncbi:hypothetical protein [Schlesneria sp. DSM 10557]|uniref:hypothetical protein n=1 Tax=Schlesneria sp. DSM 10557 TaxID=3044399 RepID=UPI00359F47F0
MLLSIVSSHGRRIACRMLCLFLLLCLAGEFVCSEESLEPSSTCNTREQEVAVWIEKARNSGCLDVEFYPANKRPKPFDGWTDFHLSLEYKYNHNVRWKGAKGKVLDVSIVPAFTTIKPSISHMIKLPESIERDQWHTSVLGRHELDHVAIGMHPRLMMLATHLVKNLGRLSRTAGSTSEVTLKWAQEEINSAVDARTQALHSLVVINNERLDSLTRHGGRDLVERGTFFERLYLKENLDEVKFRFLGESMKLLDTKEYQEATLPFPH